MRAAQFIEIIDEHHPIVAKGLQPLIFQHNDLLDHWQGVPHFEIFIQLLFVFHDQKAGRAINANMFKLGRRVSRINAIGYAAAAHNRHVEKQPFLAVFGNNRNDIAGLQPHMHHRRAQFTRMVVIFVPAKFIPTAELFLAHGEAVA